MNTAHHAAAAGSNTPAINRTTKDVAVPDRIGAALESALTQNAATRRSQEDRPPDPQVIAPQADANGVGRGDQESGHADYPASEAGKQFATLQARYALAGFALLELADGSLLATRWNCCKPLVDATAALRFLRQMGGTL